MGAVIGFPFDEDGERNKGQTSVSENVDASRTKVVENIPHATISQLANNNNKIIIRQDAIVNYYEIT